MNAAFNFNNRRQIARAEFRNLSGGLGQALFGLAHLYFDS